MSPKRAKDNLDSKAFATFQDLISEGEIEGFATPSKEGITDRTSTSYKNALQKDIFLNNTPILTSGADNTSPQDRDFNFRDVDVDTRFGTSSQTLMNGIVDTTETRSPTGIGTTVTNADGSATGETNGAVTSPQITNTNVDAIIVTLTWQQIQKFESNGDIEGLSVEYRIQISYQGGTFVNTINPDPEAPVGDSGKRNKYVVSGRTPDAFSRDHRINLDRTKIDAGTAFPVQIRVTRLTIDSQTPTTKIDAFIFTSIQEVIDDNQTYPNSAYVGIRLAAEEFSSTPSRKFRIRGVKVRIPGAGAASSGTPTVDSQTGRIIYPSNYIFNGTMNATRVWCSCPAMILLDLLTNKRYGLGDHIAPDQTSDSTTFSNLDLFSFVAASKFANELVDDNTGAGTKEARFSCNVNIQSPKQAFEAINELSGVMRCMPIWSAGSISLTQDKPTTSKYIFNLSNVGEEGFLYQGTSAKQRHSIVSVSYFNMDSQQIDFEIVGDSDPITTEQQTRQDKFGTDIKKIVAFACTSRGQAARLGKAILFAEENETETVTFTTSIDSGVVVRPGNVISINDPVRAENRTGGRVTAVTHTLSSTALTIDAEASTTLPNLYTDTNIANPPTISVLLPDGTFETRNISEILNGVVTCNIPFSQEPNVFTPFVIDTNDIKTQLFRVVQVSEEDGVNYAITAVKYIENKYGVIEDGEVIAVRNISTLLELKPSPTNLVVIEKQVLLEEVFQSLEQNQLIISFEAVQGVSQYQLVYKYEDDNSITEILTGTDFTIFNARAGKYKIEVFSFNAALQLSAIPTSIIFFAHGLLTPTEDVTGINLIAINEQLVKLTFNRATQSSILNFGKVHIRHSMFDSSTATFSKAQSVITPLPGSSTEAIVPALGGFTSSGGTYLIKFEDGQGHFSLDTPEKIAYIPVNLSDSKDIATDREDNDSSVFSGTKTNTVFDSTKAGLILTAPASNATGTYEFASTLDLGGIFSVIFKRHFKAEGYYINADIDSRVALIDTWIDFDGALAESPDAAMTMRSTLDDPSSSPTYTAYRTLVHNVVRGRAFQFKTELSTVDVAQNIDLEELGIVASLPSRTEQSSVIASGSGAKAVTFTAPFFVGTAGLGNENNFLPSISISAQNMATGDYFELSGITGTGFTVHFKNSSNASINRNFTYTAVGFGKGG